MSNIIHLTSVSVSFECDEVGDAGGNKKQTIRFSQEVGEIHAYLLIFFQIIRIVFENDCLILSAQVRDHYYLILATKYGRKASKQIKVELQWLEYLWDYQN